MWSYGWTKTDIIDDNEYEEEKEEEQEDCF